MNEPERGMVVLGPGGQVGTVDEVIYENTGEAARVMVQRDDGQGMVLQPGTYRVDNGMLRITPGGSRPMEGQTGGSLDRFATQDIYQTQQLGEAGSVETRDVPAGEGMVIPVMREEVRVTRREVERGGVRVHKRVEAREEVVEQPAFRDEVSVERVPIGQPVAQEVVSRQEGDTLIIPVLEEMLVVEKRLVLKEEIRITKRRVDETERARVVLREEHVEIEELPDPAQSAEGR